MREPTERETRLLDAAVVAGGLGPRYSQPHREYHNLMHVEDVLLRIEELEPPQEHELALALAAWFHDAVYQPGNDDNEDRSAYVAYDALEQVGADPALIGEVVRLVRLTATHDPDAGDVPGAVLSDADLAILAAPRDRYERYVDQIRVEYVHVPDDQFRIGRARVLQAFLDRPAIYRTAHGRRHWEEPARTNLAAEIAVLSAT